MTQFLRGDFKLEQHLIDFIESMANFSPILATIFMVVGILRVINKPLFSILKSVAKETPTKADDDALEAVEKSKAYVWMTYALDWLGSIKTKSELSKPKA